MPYSRIVLFGRIVHWLLVSVLLLYLVSGFGITEFRILESLTFGVINKPVAFKIHEAIFTPFLVLLVLHIVHMILIKRWSQSSKI